MICGLLSLIIFWAIVSSDLNNARRCWQFFFLPLPVIVFFSFFFIDLFICVLSHSTLAISPEHHKFIIHISCHSLILALCHKEPANVNCHAAPSSGCTASVCPSLLASCLFFFPHTWHKSILRHFNTAESSEEMSFACSPFTGRENYLSERKHSSYFALCVFMR